MPRSVNESDRLSVEIYDRSTDMLSDSSRFPTGNIRFTDPVLKRGLAVVHMPHECNDRAARHNIFRVVFVFEIFGMLGVFSGFLSGFFFLCADGQFDSAFFRVFNRDFRRNGLIDACQHIHLHESADNFIRFFAESFRKGFYDNRGSDRCG